MTLFRVGKKIVVEEVKIPTTTHRLSSRGWLQRIFSLVLRVEVRLQVIHPTVTAFSRWLSCCSPFHSGIGLTGARAWQGSISFATRGSFDIRSLTRRSNIVVRWWNQPLVSHSRRCLHKALLPWIGRRREHERSVGSTLGRRCSKSIWCAGVGHRSMKSRYQGRILVESRTLDGRLWGQDGRRRSHWILVMREGRVALKVGTTTIRTKMPHVRRHGVMGWPTTDWVGTSAVRGRRALHASMGRGRPWERRRLFVRDGGGYFSRAEWRCGILLEWRIAAEGLDRVDGISQDLGCLLSGHVVPDVFPSPGGVVFLEESKR